VKIGESHISVLLFLPMNFRVSICKVASPIRNTAKNLLKTMMLQNKNTRVREKIRMEGRTRVPVYGSV
jgi:hypothetical protein